MYGAYAGIGSRRTPPPVLRAMANIGAALQTQGLVLRTGGAPGADSAFLAGAVRNESHETTVELYLPWLGYRANELDLLVPGNGTVSTRFGVTKEGLTLAEEHHPVWERLGPAERLLHGRNSHQVLGWDLKQPVDFVLCWTPDGAFRRTTALTGGTGQAIRIAVSLGIPVYNLQRPVQPVWLRELAQNGNPR